MNDIVVNKQKLIEVMKKNRAEHHEIVVEAQEGFRAKVIERLDEMLELARNGKKIDINVGLTMPVDMTSEYDRAIGMLEMDINETVELDSNEYNSYVLDNWSWSRQSSISNSMYSAKAMQKL